jgi:SAM-dependent methyltransferase
VAARCGCGRGGTASYVQHNGWGKVLGLDIDPKSIGYAKKAYPDVEFMIADAMDFAKGLSRRFDIIYLFNTFYAFSDHRHVLGQLRESSHGSGALLIFDYLLKSGSRGEFPFKEWNPLDFSSIKNIFSASGWRVIRMDDISALYGRWYRELVSRIETNFGSIIAFAGNEWFDFVRLFYPCTRKPRV